MRKLLAGMLLSLGVIMAPLSGAIAFAEDAIKRDGWVSYKTTKSFKELNASLNGSIKANGMRRVTGASASAGAKGRGLTIPGNRIVGVYRNDFAIRMLEASIAAGIEAPIRYYVTENEDGTASLSFKTPTKVFSPYMEEGGDQLKELASELDALFGKIASEAVE